MILNIKKSEHALLWAHEIGDKEKMKPLINDYKSAYGWVMNICLCNKERKEMINIIKKQRDIISIDEMLRMDAVNFVETKEEVIYLAKRISKTIELKSTDWVFNLDKFFKLRYVTFHIFNNRSDFKFLFENEVFKILYSFLSCKNLYETAMNLFSVSCNYSEKNLFCLKKEYEDVYKNCREKILIDELIQNRENEKQKIINPKNTEKMNEKIIKESFDEEVINLEVRDDGQTAIPVESIEVMGVEIVSNETVKSSALVAEFDLPKTPAKKPISLQVFETLTPERISELQGLNESQLAIVKANPVIQITDKKTYELAKKTAATLLKASTAIDGSSGIEATATKYLNTFKSMLKNALQPIAKLTRDPYDEQKTIISSWENAELLREQAEQRAKLAKIKLRTDELFAVPFTFNGSIYSIGTVYCTPSQVETATDGDFKIIVENGKTIKQALDAELAIQAGKDKEIAELKAKLAALTQLSEMSNTEPEPTAAIPISNSVPAPELKSSPANQVENFMNPAVTEKPAYVLPSIENTLLNALDLKNAEHLEKPAYIKCRGYYVQGLIDAAKEIELILNDITPNPVKKSERIANLCEILKKSV